MEESGESCGSETETGSQNDGSDFKDKTNPHSAKDRWGKLKTTMAATNHINVKKNRRLDRGDSFLRKFSTRNQTELETSQNTEDTHSETLRNTKHRTLKSFVVHPSGGFMFYWLGVVNLSVLYNLWTSIAREAFREIQRSHMTVWLCLDGLADFVYICDIFVQFRTGYLQQGLMVYDSTKLCRNYLKDKCFIADLVSLLPLDIIQFWIGTHPMLRFPRFLKIYRSIRFMHMYESRTAYPNLLRVASLSHILFLGSHWFAAFYYLISEAEGFKGDWSYPSPDGDFAAVTRKYLASLYWSTLTLTTIGDLPPPDTNWQYVFVIVSYLIGVFIFATIVGQVGNVITNRNASRQEFERLLDGAKFYMQMHNVPPELQKRVQRWYDYVWTRGRLNCNDINSLGLLPDKLKTELALHVNLGTLKKVTIFQKCRPEFLHDLMLKMRAYIFTPGDLICRRGEVAREMFIIADGVVEILGDNATVLTQMSTGDFFGEIGILNLDGGINRRTADVRSVGYSELFVLSREDVLAALKDHPDAEQIIREYGQRRLKETVEHRKMVKSAPSSPELIIKGNRASHKVYTENANPGLCRQQVKYLQKLPHMSPKLKKLFHLKNRRINKGRQRRQSESPTHDVSNTGNRNGSPDIERAKIHPKDNGISNPVLKVNSVDGKEHCCIESEVDKQSGANLADLVLNLLKSKRPVGYKSVQSEENEHDKQFDDIPISNLGEITSSSCDRTGSGCNSNNKNNTDVDKNVKYVNTVIHGINKSHINPENGHDYHENKICTNSSNLCPPKIVLTHDDDRISSASSDNESESEAVNERPTLANRLPFRHHVGRKSSPSILPSPIKTGSHRKFSGPPPLDLPIEVPPFSNFRGIGSGNSTEISLSLDRFRIEIEQKMVTMEMSYKETQEHLHNALAIQEKLIRNILKKLAAREKSIDDVTQPEVTGNEGNETRSTSNSNKPTSGTVLYKRSLSHGDTTNNTRHVIPHASHVVVQTETITEDVDENRTNSANNVDTTNDIELISESITSGTNGNDCTEMEDEFDTRVTHL